MSADVSFMSREYELSDYVSIRNETRKTQLLTSAGDNEAAMSLFLIRSLIQEDGR
jgi:hypothetical protein